MKLSITLICFIAGTVYVYGQPLDDPHENVVTGCKTQLGLPDDFKPSKDSADPKYKCFSACVLEKQKLMVDGKVAFPDSYFAPENAEKELVEETKAMFRSCADTANKQTDKCEVAASVVKCIEEKGKELFSAEG